MTEQLQTQTNRFQDTEKNLPPLNECPECGSTNLTFVRNFHREYKITHYTDDGETLIVKTHPLPTEEFTHGVIECDDCSYILENSTDINTVQVTENGDVFNLTPKYFWEEQ